MDQIEKPQCNENGNFHKFPQTRFQGSKQRILNWFHEISKNLEYKTVLDGFSGSGVVSYYFKSQNKIVTSNDLMKSAYMTSKALIENSSHKIGSHMTKSILALPKYNDHQHTIEDLYHGHYFTESENIWLDAIIHNINLIDNEYQRAIFFWALFQACIIKRPYNLFHRKNLYMRTEDVKRSFGNKTTWDRDFISYLKKFIEQANQAIFDNGFENTAKNMDIRKLDQSTFDAVYLDPPYMKNNIHLSGNDYQNYYHFLEGILSYDTWKNKIDLTKKHLPFTTEKSDWIQPKKIKKSFENIFRSHQDSTIIISYNTEGFPNIGEIEELLLGYKDQTEIFFRNIKYALKKKNWKNTEIILIGKSK